MQCGKLENFVVPAAICPIESQQSKRTNDQEAIKCPSVMQPIQN